MDVELALNNATMPQTQAYQQTCQQQTYQQQPQQQIQQPQTVPFTNQVNYQSYPEHYDNDEGMPF